MPFWINTKIKLDHKEDLICSFFKILQMLFKKGFTFRNQTFGERPLTVRTPKAFALVAKVALEFKPQVLKFFC